jgi:UDP-GlcNAc:undecaprenyl-phosphate GlcNAc-1-phosphate transferase
MSTLLVALLTTLACTPGVVWLAHRWQLVDVPNHRSSHAAPVPRGGGVAVVIGTVLAVVIANDWDDALVAVVVCSTVLAAVGLLDDRQGLPPLVRLTAQVVTPGVGVLLVAPRHGVGLVVAAFVAVVVLTGYVNAFNFMDGINGISGSQGAIAALALAIVAHEVDHHPMQIAALAVCGAAIGFLPFNAVRARVFLGDVGSYFLGCWLARRGASLLEAHREHTYQRLTQLGYSHVAVAAVCAVCTSVCAVAMLLVLDRSVGAQLAMFTGCLCVVTAYLALPAVVARSSTPQSESVR